jgi:hypothetical protein
MSHWVDEGIAFLHDGMREEGERALRIAVKEDDRDITAWLWLSQAVKSDAEKITCLLRVLELDPHNVVARQKMSALQDKGRSKGEEHVSPFKLDVQVDSGSRADAFQFEEPPVELKMETEVSETGRLSESPFAQTQEEQEQLANTRRPDINLARATKAVIIILILLGIAVIVVLLVFLLK